MRESEANFDSAAFEDFLEREEENSTFNLESEVSVEGKVESTPESIMNKRSPRKEISPSKFVQAKVARACPVISTEPIYSESPMDIRFRTQKAATSKLISLPN